jgi:hypothetical protein
MEAAGSSEILLTTGMFIIRHVTYSVNIHIGYHRHEFGGKQSSTDENFSTLQCVKTRIYALHTTFTHLRKVYDSVIREMANDQILLLSNSCGFVDMGNSL